MNLPVIRTRGRFTALFAILALVLATSCQHQPPVTGATTQGTGGINATQQLDKPYLILVSLDGFRWDYMDRYPTPNLNHIAKAGSRAERLLPVYPSLTFPNHYSIATGLYPAHHGLVGNGFPDAGIGKWYSMKDRSTVSDTRFYYGEPIWVTAEIQGMVAASYFFVGSEAPVKGIQPSHWRTYSADISGEERVDQVLAWLALPERTRPHMYTLYFADVDSYSHWYGTDSAENIEAICRVDGFLGRLARGIAKLPYADQVNIIVLSDHGLGDYLDEPPFILDKYTDISGMSFAEGGSHMSVYLETKDPDRAREIVDTVNRYWQHGHAYLASEAPVQWHIDDNPRYPDVILAPEMGYTVLSRANKSRKIKLSGHGWPPEASDMHGFFIASGPNIRPGLNLGPVSMVDVYPLMTAILGLQSPDNIDGDSSKLAEPLYIERGK